MKLTFFPANIAAIDFVDVSSGDYALASTSPYVAADTNGNAIGADFNAVVQHVATAVAGNVLMGP